MTLDAIRKIVLAPKVIVHGGQLGVDRGAHHGARAARIQIFGYMPANCEDEAGMIPEEIRGYLVRCKRKGYAARTDANLDFADALLVIVPDRARPARSPGTARTLDGARERSLPYLVVDHDVDVSTVRQWVSSHCVMTSRQKLALMPETNGTRLMVAGPRASKWPEGEAVAQRFVAALAQQAPPKAIVDEIARERGWA